MLSRAIHLSPLGRQYKYIMNTFGLVMSMLIERVHQFIARFVINMQPSA